MSVASIQLSGEALTGVSPHLDHLQRFVSAPVPQSVKLGALPPKPGRKLLRFASYVDANATAPPAKIDWHTKAGASIGRMYLNDQYGDCVIAGKAHAVGVWTANDTDSGGVVVGADGEIYNTYQNWCGPGDNGCVIADVLDKMRASGIPLNGQRYKIDGYVAVDWSNKQQVQVALLLFGALSIGINLPSAWTSAAVWDVTNTQIVGGHDVTCVGYDETGVQIASWGRVYTITWRAFTAQNWLTECYAILAPSWYGNDKLAPSGFAVEALQADLAAIGGGNIPDWQPPVVPPVVPPVPVPPPAPAPLPTLVLDPITFHTSFFGGPVTIHPTGKLVAPTAAFINPLALYRDVRKLVADAKAMIPGDIALVKQAIADARAGNWSAVPDDALAAIEKLLNDAPVLIADGSAVLVDLGIVV